MNTGMEAILSKWLNAKHDSYVDLIIAGRVFGGRLGEGIKYAK